LSIAICAKRFRRPASLDQQVSILMPSSRRRGTGTNRKALVRMTRLAGPLLICGLACWSAGAYAQATASPPTAELPAPELPAPEAASTEPTFAAWASKPTSAAAAAEPTFAALRAEPTFATRPIVARAQSPAERAAQGPPTPDDICRTIEQSAAENGLPVEFFARVIWQESRFNAFAVSNKGAQGIAQFMPRTAGARGLLDPFDPIEALHHSAAYLHELMDQFGNLGLAAAGYNAGPGRVSAWLSGKRSLPGETRNYVAIITGWTVDEWASASPPQKAETTIPQGVPCTRLANLILAPKEKAHQIATYVPRWGAQLTSNWSESRAWETYRTLQRQYASLIGDREPIVLHARLPGMGAMARTIIRIGDDNRAPLDALCNKLIAAGGACVVLRNQIGRARLNGGAPEPGDAPPSRGSRRTDSRSF
jgi:soluble lytic murein transglycosylase-like protein